MSSASGWVDAVADEGPRWVLLASGTVVSELAIDALDALDGVLPERYAVEDGRALNSDQPSPDRRR